MNLRTLGAFATAWLEHRTGLPGALQRLLQTPVDGPAGRVRAVVAAALAGLVLFQCGTGLLLALRAQPTPATAHAALTEVVTRAPFGWLVRSLHVWGASFVIAAGVLHLGTVFLRGAYRPPRELTWTSGLALMATLLALCFTGFLLPWDERAIAGARIGLQELATAPIVGPLLANLARGGPDVGAGTLTRFFIGHVVLLPALLCALGVFHVHQVIRHGRVGMDGPGEVGRQTLTLQGAGAVATLGILVLVATGCPAALGPVADPLAPAPPGIRPEWFFVPVFELLHRMPGRVLGLDGLAVTNGLLGLVTLVWVTLPWWDGGPGPRQGPGTLGRILGVVTAAGVIGLTVISYARQVAAP